MLDSATMPLRSHARTIYRTFCGTLLLFVATSATVGTLWAAPEGATTGAKDGGDTLKTTLEAPGAVTSQAGEQAAEGDSLADAGSGTAEPTDGGMGRPAPGVVGDASAEKAVNEDAVTEGAASDVPTPVDPLGAQNVIDGGAPVPVPDAGAGAGAGAGAETAALAPPTRQPHPGDDLDVYVVTFGPEKHPFFMFGHNAIWIQDNARGRGSVYNFGTFAFETEGLIEKFLQGRLTYWLSVTPAGMTVAHYRNANRDVFRQELRLTSDEKWRLKVALDKNARPENRNYLYDYFSDNCSARSGCR